MSRSPLHLLWVLSLVTGGCSCLSDFDGYTFVGDDGGFPDVAPTVLAATPQGEVLDGRTPIVVTFDVPVVATNADVTVTLDTAITAAGSVVVSGTTLTFVPSEPLAPQGSYEVVVGTGVESLTGRPLAAPYSFGFTVPATGAGAAVPRRLDTLGSGDVVCPHLAMDEAGNAIAVFNRGGTIYTAVYRAGIGWEDTTMLAVGTDAVLAISRNGRAAVAYTALVAGVPRVALRVSEPNTYAFGAASLADEATSEPVDATPPTCTIEDQGKNVAINDDGVVALTWTTYRPTAGDPYVGWMHIVRSATGVWGTPTWSGNYPFSQWPEKAGVAVDGAGNVLLRFRSDSGGGTDHARRIYTASATTWGALTREEATSTAYWPQIHAEADGKLTSALALYDFGTSSHSVVVRHANFDGTMAASALTVTTSAAPQDLFLSTKNGRWFTWRSGTSMGVAGMIGNNWDYHPTFIGDATATYPTVVGTEDGLVDERGLVVYQAGSTIKWSRIEHDIAGFMAATPRTLPTGANPAHDARVSYDVAGRHGILVYVSDDPADSQIFATNFHVLPPRTP